MMRPGALTVLCEGVCVGVQGLNEQKVSAETEKTEDFGCG